MRASRVWLYVAGWRDLHSDWRGDSGDWKDGTVMGSDPRPAGTAACICIGGPVVSAGLKVLTWECSHCGKRRRVRRDQVTVIRV